MNENDEHSNTKYVRDENRNEKIKVLMSLPQGMNGYCYDDYNVNNEEDMKIEKNLKELLRKTKEEGYSFIAQLEQIKEFNNPENINVIIIYILYIYIESDITLSNKSQTHTFTFINIQPR